jgi:hypothetical protein
VLANKVVAANRWTFSLDTELEVSAYQGDDAADAGRAFLSGVTADVASIPTLAETDSAIGQLVGVEGVGAALANLDAAQEAQIDAIEAIALAVNANSAAPLEGDALDGFVEDYVDDVTAGIEDPQDAVVAAETAVDDAEADVLDAQAALANARATVGTDAQLQANYLSAYAAETPADLQALEEARGNLALDVSQNGTNVELLTSVRAAIATYVAAGGNTAALVGAPVTDVAGLLSAINTALSSGNPETASETLLATLEGIDFVPGAIANSTADEALDDLVDEVAERGELIDEVNDAEIDVPGIVAAETAIETRQGLIDAVPTAQAELAEAQAYLAQVESLVDAYNDAGLDIIEARDAFGDLGFNTPVELGATFGATADSDILLVTDGQDTIVTNFGAGGNDILFIGNEFTAVNIASNLDLDDTTGPASDTAGSASALEVFIQQVGNNTVLYIEGSAVEGNVTTAPFSGEVITLVGVDASDLTFNNGYFSIA